MERAINAKADELYEAINKRPTWIFFIVFTAVFMTIIGTSFIYTTMSMDAMERMHIRENERQDKVIERMEQKLDKIIEKLDRR